MVRGLLIMCGLLYVARDPLSVRASLDDTGGASLCEGAFHMCGGASLITAEFILVKRNFSVLAGAS